MRNILKIFFTIGIVLILLGTILFFLEDEKKMFNYITVNIIGIITIGTVLKIYSKDIKRSNEEKSKKINTFVWTWILAVLFAYPVLLALIKVLLSLFY